VSKPLWSIPIGDLSFDGPRLPHPHFWWGMAFGVFVMWLVFL